MQNPEVRLVKDDAKGVTRVFYHNGEKKTHIGDISFDTSKFTPCPDLEESPARLALAFARLLDKVVVSLANYAEENSPSVSILLVL